MSLVAHASGVKSYAAAAYAPDPSPCDTNPANGIQEFCPSTWQSTPQFVADINQPPPTVDPFTKFAYFLGIHGQAAQQDAPFVLYCVDSATGLTCPGWSDKGKRLPALWGPTPP